MDPPLNIIKRVKQTHSLFMSIEISDIIYACNVRVSYVQYVNVESLANIEEVNYMHSECLDIFLDMILTFIIKSQKRHIELQAVANLIFKQQWGDFSSGEQVFMTSFSFTITSTVSCMDLQLYPNYTKCTKIKSLF